MAETSSVMVTVNSPLDVAMPFMTSRAVGIESWRNPRVAVSIITRITGPGEMG
jgi:hypothetical protein